VKGPRKNGTDGLLLVLLAIAAWSLMVPLPASAPSGDLERAQRLYLQWMWDNDRAPLAALHAQRHVLGPAFASVVRHGPPGADLVRARREADARYRPALPATVAAHEVSPMQRVAREMFVQKQTRQFERAYRQRAGEGR
jgi:hypothetical protein